MIAIVDYDVGNVASIANMFARVGAKAVITRDPLALKAADKIVLPGVGAFDTAIQNLQSLGIRGILDEVVLKQKTPTLGICLGAQIIGKGSAEGRLPGLGWLDFRLVKFSASDDQKLRIPHMGWNAVAPTRADLDIFEGVPVPMRFYFVHSYRMETDDPNISVGMTTYGAPFASVIGKGNILAMQFHPEKSHKYGIAICKNFAEKFVSC
jgi:glutamine amidotransferase